VWSNAVTWSSMGKRCGLGFSTRQGSAPSSDRMLAVDLWYLSSRVGHAPAPRGRCILRRFPAEPSGRGRLVFRFPAIAVRDGKTPPSGTRVPLVIVSHGYSNDPAA